jgi:hypothetical protein
MKMSVRINNSQPDSDYIHGLVHEKKMIQENLKILQKAPYDAKLIIGDRELPDKTMRYLLEKMLTGQLNEIICELDRIEIRYKKPE